jgi:hypothetical protein
MIVSLSGLPGHLRKTTAGCSHTCASLSLQVVITPHPLNVETEMTICEFKELLTRVGLIKTKALKKE